MSLDVWICLLRNTLYFPTLFHFGYALEIHDNINYKTYFEDH